MTLTVVGYIVAAAILIAGAATAARLQSGRRATLLGAAIAVAAVVAWFSWLLGTSA
ncbi:MAG TPA: hypothetical protein VFV59_06085 [Candidatus Limnocylindria bacterium]|nr:hypothetical protein [Candidatus Limnocylindria bacterium]